MGAPLYKSREIEIRHMNQPRKPLTGRVVTAASLFLIVCLLAACSGPAVDNEKPQVALIMKSLANEFFSTMAAGAESHQQAHADQYDLVINGIKDERDLTRQVALVEEMVARGVDAIVIAPADSKALVPVLKRALEHAPS